MRFMIYDVLNIISYTIIPHDLHWVYNLNKSYLICCFFLIGFGSQPAMRKGYSWLSIRELLLAVLRCPYRMQGMEL